MHTKDYLGDYVWTGDNMKIDLREIRFGGVD
jgi:hypothetical protein